MQEELKLYIGICISCGQAKQPQAYLKAPLQHILCYNFGDGVEIDHIIPQKEGKTPRGFRYILTITDIFSGYVTLVPMKKMTADANIRAIIHRWVLRHGCPCTVFCDNQGQDLNAAHAIPHYLLFSAINLI